jgi:hypothetical protein
MYSREHLPYIAHIHTIVENWDCGRAISFLGIFVSNFLYWFFEVCTDKKRKQNFPHIKENSDGIGCKVIYEEGLPNT